MTSLISIRIPEPTVVNDQETREYLNELVRALESITDEIGNLISEESGAPTFPSTTTDNSLIKTVGTNGSEYEETGIIVDDSNNVSGVNSFSASGAISGTTLNTGQGANELYAMNQDVQTTDDVEFANIDNTPIGQTTPAAAAFTSIVADSINFGQNNLNYYEEGTWTPTLYGTSTAGTPTYVNQEGSYVVIGNIVFYTARIRISAIGGATGYIRIGGIPFNVGAIAETHTHSIGFLTGYNMSGSSYWPYVSKEPSASYFSLGESNGSTAALLTWGSATSNLQLRIEGFFLRS